MRTVKTKYFDYGQEEIDYLKSVDKMLGAAITRMGKVERVIIPDLFTALVYAIVGQLISVKTVHTIWERMQDQIGEISPQNMAMQTADDIQKCGMTMKKAICINNIAVTIMQGAFHLDELYDLSDTEVTKS